MSNMAPPPAILPSARALPEGAPRTASAALEADCPESQNAVTLVINRDNSIGSAYREVLMADAKVGMCASSTFPADTAVVPSCDERRGENQSESAFSTIVSIEIPRAALQQRPNDGLIPIGNSERSHRLNQNAQQSEILLSHPT